MNKAKAVSKEKESLQEREINRIIERIGKITGNAYGSLDISAEVLKEVINLRETNEPESVIYKRISKLTGLNENDPRIKEILHEIEEKPFENSYKPFENSILSKLLKDFED
jgi:cell fate (sporulation/competence/biofilm development) regulator YmcA (YheA/YmcA/DUF963 family)